MKKILGDIYNSRLDKAAELVNNWSEELLFAGFRSTATTWDSITIANEWHAIKVFKDCTALVYKRSEALAIKRVDIDCAVNTILSTVFYGTHYCYVGGLAVCPRQKFGAFKTDDDLRMLFSRLQCGDAELQYKSDKAFRWRLADGTELTIKESSFEDTSHNEENIMTWLDNSDKVDIFSLVAASALFEVKVQFSSGSGLYSYKSEVEHAAGDKVVVDTPSSGLQVVTVVDCSQGLQGGNFPKYKWIVAKVDTTRYEELVENEKLAIKRIDAAKRADKVKRELEALGVSEGEILAMLGLASKTDSQ